MKKQWVIIFSLFAVMTLFLTLPNDAVACSPAMPEVVIQAPLDESLLTDSRVCLDKECLYAVEPKQTEFQYQPTTTYLWQIVSTLDLKDWEHYAASIYTGSGDSLTIEYSYIFDGEDISQSRFLTDPALYEAIDTIVLGDLSGVRQTFYNQVQSWIDDDRGTFLSGDVTIVPYSSIVENEIIEKQENITNCHYQKIVRDGDWMFLSATSREYCHTYGGGGGMCPAVGISIPEFYSYLLKENPSGGWPYLIGLGAAVLLLIVLVVYLTYKKEWKLFFKPSKTLNILMALSVLAVIFLTYVTFWLGTLYYLVVFYFVLSLVQYIFRKVQMRKIIDKDTSGH